MKPNRTALQALRRANRWGLRELERRTGLNRGYLSRLERGRRGASLTTLTVLADLYDVPVTDLTSEDTK
jgi:transcriptional regulator with XRE-family HTH domain